MRREGGMEETLFPTHTPPPPPASGSLHAKFDIQEGPSVPKPTGVQFVCEGATLSGVGLEVAGSGGYRISLLKFKSISGEKLCCDP